MKKFLLSAIAVFAMSLCSFAQMPVCEDACTPHANEADYSTGVIPTYPTEFPVLHVGEAVDQCVSIKVPSQINGSAINEALSSVTITVNSVTLNELVDLPTGLTACASANPMNADGTYTLRITGTPTQAGTYELKMKAEIDGESSSMFLSMTLVNYYLNGMGVSTNITITVDGESIPSPVADFTTNPEASSVGDYLAYISINQYESVTFTNASTNAHHIAWEFEGGTPATSTENTVTVAYNETPSGLYFTATLTAYNEEGTVSDSKSVYVRVASVDPDAVEASFTTDPEYTDLYLMQMLAIETGTTVTYTSTCNANTDHIAWTFEGGNPGTSTANTVNVTYATQGSYTTTLVAYNANETRTDTVTLSVTVTDPVAVEENAISEIGVYPNPTSSIINIAAEGMQNITIIDMTGRVVMSKDVNSNFETISAEGFAKANYMVRIATADGIVVKNIVVE